MQRRDDARQARVVADDGRRASPRGQLLAQQLILGSHAALRQRALDEQEQMIGVDGLGKEVERAFLHRHDGVLNTPVCGHHDDRQPGIDLLGAAQDADTVTRQQPEVGEDQVGPAVADLLQGLGLIGRFEHTVALILERVPEHRAQRVLVLDDQDGCRRTPGRGH